MQLRSQLAYQVLLGKFAARLEEQLAQIHFRFADALANEGKEIP